MKFICEKCGSSDVEEKAWVKINTGKIVETIEGDDFWCCQCEQETNIKEKE